MPKRHRHGWRNTQLTGAKITHMCESTLTCGPYGNLLTPSSRSNKWIFPSVRRSCRTLVGANLAQRDTWAASAVTSLQSFPSLSLDALGAYATASPCSPRCQRSSPIWLSSSLPSIHRLLRADTLQVPRLSRSPRSWRIQSPTSYQGMSLLCEGLGDPQLVADAAFRSSVQRHWLAEDPERPHFHVAPSYYCNTRRQQPCNAVLWDDLSGIGWGQLEVFEQDVQGCESRRVLGPDVAISNALCISSHSAVVLMSMLRNVRS
jgi:hypothetical protein